jgi:hypothetical protein
VALIEQALLNAGLDPNADIALVRLRRELRELGWNIESLRARRWADVVPQIQLGAEDANRYWRGLETN